MLHDGCVTDLLQNLHCVGTSLALPLDLSFQPVLEAWWFSSERFRTQSQPGLAQPSAELPPLSNDDSRAPEWYTNLPTNLNKNDYDKNGIF